jgi:hypothetical protein
MFWKRSKRARRYLGSSSRFSCIHLTNAAGSFIGGEASQLKGLGTVARALSGKAALAAVAADNVKNVRRCILLALTSTDAAERTAG